MKNSQPFIEKEDQELPDSYGITVHYRSGRSESFQVAHHVYLNDDKAPPRIEIATKDNLWSVILWDVIARLEFDKNFSKVIEVQQKRILEKGNQAAQNNHFH